MARAPVGTTAARRRCTSCVKPLFFGICETYAKLTRNLQPFFEKTSCSRAWIFLKAPYQVRSLRLSVRTPGFQPGKRGSIPLGTAIGSPKALLHWDLNLQAPALLGLLNPWPVLMIVIYDNRVAMRPAALHMRVVFGQIIVGMFKRTRFVFCPKDDAADHPRSR